MIVPVEGDIQTFDIPQPATLTDKEVLPNALYEIGLPIPKGMHIAARGSGLQGLGDSSGYAIDEEGNLDVPLNSFGAANGGLSLNLPTTTKPSWISVLLVMGAVGVGAVLIGGRKK